MYYEHSNAQYLYAYRHHYLPDLHMGYSSTDSILVLICYTMDEQCDVLRSFEAKTYEDVRDCGEVPKSVEEGVQGEKRHKALLLNLEDRDREVEWSNNLEAHLLEVSEPVYDGKPWGIASILSRERFGKANPPALMIHKNSWRKNKRLWGCDAVAVDNALSDSDDVN